MVVRKSDPGRQDVIIVGNHKLTNYTKILVPLLPVRLKPNSVAALL